MKVLVTGASGYIGGNLTKKLASEGYYVHALIHKKQSALSNNSNIEYLSADITDPKSLQKITDTYDAVFHCAALVKDYGPQKDFININVQGTHNIAQACKNTKCFVYLGHSHYESNQKLGYYSQSKYQAEKELLQQYHQHKFPVVIIRPGNVFGPGATIWVTRLLKAIQQNRITLIDNGKGIFHHTYIDNLIDALLLTINNKKAIGQTFDITDGDHQITWNQYLNDLAAIINKPPITKNISKKTAKILSKIFVQFSLLTKKPPLLSPTAVSILTNTNKISIEKAQTILGYTPKISYETAIKRIQEWFTANQNILK
ncbi:MAG: NAD(P)-dependent oxidoreductase [Thermoplasmatota archaeon]